MYQLTLGGIFDLVLNWTAKIMIGMIVIKVLSDSLQPNIADYFVYFPIFYYMFSSPISFVYNMIKDINRLKRGSAGDRKTGQT